MPLVLGSNCQLSPDVEDAALWRITRYKPYRGGHSVAVQIWSENGRQLLCSDLSKGIVHLIQEAEADKKAGNGDWCYCVAWDCTPEELEVAPEDATFLDFFEQEEAPS